MIESPYEDETFKLESNLFVGEEVEVREDGEFYLDGAAVKEAGGLARLNVNYDEMFERVRKKKAFLSLFGDVFQEETLPDFFFSRSSEFEIDLTKLKKALDGYKLLTGREGKVYLVSTVPYCRKCRAMEALLLEGRSLDEVSF